MSKLEKLDLMGVASLAAVTAALLVAWMVTTHNAASQVRPVAQAPAVTFTNDGSMKLTVTASDAAPAPVHRDRPFHVRQRHGRPGAGSRAPARPAPLSQP